jgi:phosphatidylglycerophosphatase A
MNDTACSPRDVAFGSVQGFFALGFGSGLAPLAPGTAGTLAAVPLAALMKLLPAVVYWPLLLLFFVAGIHFCDVASRRLGQHDPGAIVWDEIVAYCLAVAFLPMHWAWFAAAFVLFRLFDILKPWPVRLADRRFRGGFGIMFDDILAAGYAMASLHVIGLILETA